VGGECLRSEYRIVCFRLWFVLKSDPKDMPPVRNEFPGEALTDVWTFLRLPRVRDLVWLHNFLFLQIGDWDGVPSDGLRSHQLNDLWRNLMS
jgi:hypothetical protein